MAQCPGGSCFFAVAARQDSPGDPVYPLVFCAVCNTHWLGHRESAGRILNPRIPDALRDAILLDQFENFERILNELGYKKDGETPVLSELSPTETLHRKLCVFLQQAFNQPEGRRCLSVRLCFEPGEGYREEPLREWQRTRATKVMVMDLASAILDIVESEVAAKEVGTYSFSLRTTQRWGGRDIFSFVFSSPV